MPVQPKLFRVFVSSTFADMSEERQILQNDVFPRLEKYCEQHGAQFQAIDLRWGVNEESQLDQKTMDICLNEINRCQKMSPKPNFIILLGDRYGWQLLPARIDVGEFDRLRDHISGMTPSDIELKNALLQQWYKRDDNALPPEYVLQPRSKELREYAAWEPIERKLRETLRSMAERAGLTEEQRVKYFASATHQEIVLGALNPPHDVLDVREHVYAYLRNVEGLPCNETAGRYVDLVDGNVDSFAWSQLVMLRNELHTKLGEEHCVKYHATWKNDTVALSDTAAFGEMVYNHLHGVIETQLKEFVSPGEVEHERMLQNEFREKLVEHFNGRAKPLLEISRYIDDPGGKVFALIGVSGSGKSSVVAKAITDAKQRKGYYIYRFLGITSRSSDVMGLLQSLCAEITGYYGTTVEELFCNGVKDEDRSEKLKALYTENGLCKLFHSSLTLATPEKPIMLFLDALDQLSGANEEYSLYWLPREIPAHTSLVVSCLPILNNQLSTATFHNLDGLTVVEASVVLDAWFSACDCKRTLQPEQRAAILAAFDKTKLPIYLRLAFEAAKKWHSYDPVTTLPNDVSGILGIFFTELERQHTKITVSKTISYMLSGRYGGLTEKEILDMLVFDNEHWEAFLKLTHEANREEVRDRNMLPIVVWSRLFLDLEPYLTERNVWGQSVFVFYHNAFNEIARKRYMSNDKKNHEKLADYFEKQQLHYDGGMLMPNKRKCLEQPWQQTRAEMWQALIATFKNLLFINASVQAELVNPLQESFTDGIRALQDAGINTQILRSVLTFRRFFIQHLHDFVRYSGFRQFFLQTAYNEFSDGSLPAKFQKAQEGLPIFAYCRDYRSGHGIDQVRTLAGHRGPVNAVVITTDEKFVISGGVDGRINIWNLETGEQKYFFNQGAEVTNLAVSTDSKFLFSTTSAGIKVWDLVHRCLVNQLILDPGICRIGAFSLTGDGKLLIWSDDYQGILYFLPLASPEENLNDIRFRLYSNEEWIYYTNNLLCEQVHSTRPRSDIENSKKIIYAIRAHVSPVRAITVTRDGQFSLSLDAAGSIVSMRLSQIAYGGYHYTTPIDRYLGRELCVVDNDTKVVTCDEIGTIRIHERLDWNVSQSHRVLSRSRTMQLTCICGCNDGSEIATGSAESEIRRWDPIKKKYLGLHQGHLGAITKLCYSHSGHILISASRDGTVKIWDCSLASDTGEGKLRMVARGAASASRAMVVLGDSNGTLTIDSIRGDRIRRQRTIYAHQEGITAVHCVQGRILSGSRDKSVFMKDVMGFKTIDRACHHDTVGSVLITADGKLGCSAGISGELVLWDLIRRRKLRNLPDVSSGIAYLGLTCGDRMLVCCYETGEVFIHELQGEKNIRTVFHQNPVAYACVDKDKMELTGIFRNGKMRTCNLSTGRWSEVCGKGGENLHFLTISGNIPLFTTGSDLFAYDVAEPHRSVRMCGHHAEVNVACSFGKKGLILSGSDDCTVRLWATKTGDCIGILKETAEVVYLAKVGERFLLVTKDCKRVLFELWNI